MRTITVVGASVADLAASRGRLFAASQGRLFTRRRDTAVPTLQGAP